MHCIDKFKMKKWVQASNKEELYGLVHPNLALHWQIQVEKYGRRGLIDTIGMEWMKVVE